MIGLLFHVKINFPELITTSLCRETPTRTTFDGNTYNEQRGSKPSMAFLSLLIIHASLNGEPPNYFLPLHHYLQNKDLKGERKELGRNKC